MVLVSFGTAHTSKALEIVDTDPILSLIYKTFAVFEREKLQTNNSTKKDRGWRRNHGWKGHKCIEEGCPFLFGLAV